MIAHVVCFKMKDIALGKTKERNLLELKQQLETLPREIPQIRAFDFSFNESGKKYDAVLVELFENQADLDYYDTHPVHMEVKKFVKQVCDEMSVSDNAF